MEEISHLVVNGCSWAFGQGLKNIREEAWAGILSKKLNCDLVNLAIPFSSNEGILRRTCEYIYENKKFNNRPLFVIIFSQIWRKEVWMRNRYGGPCNDYVTMFPWRQIQDNSIQQKAWLDNFDEEDFLRKNMLVKTCLVNLLENHGYPYLIATNYPLNDVKQSSQDDVQKRFPNWFDFYQSVHDVKHSLGDIIEGLDKTECGHPGPNSNRLVGDFIFSEITKKYPNLQIKPQDFLRLKDYQLLGPADRARGLADWI